MGERIHKLEARLTQEEIGENITVDEWLDVEDGNKRAIVAAMSKFMWLDGQKLSADDARARIGALPLRDFNTLVDEFYKAVRGGAVPPGNGADSSAP